MTVRDQVYGRALELFLARERGVRRALARRRGLDVFLQVDDAHGLLLVQVLARLMADLPDEPLRVHVVPPPAAEVDPQPALRLPWTVRDARLLAEHHGLQGPTRADPPPAEVVEQAQGILAVDRPGRRQLEIAVEVLRAVWTDDHAGLEALATEHGAVSPAERDEALAANRDLLRELGHYQGSMVRHRGEWFWGLDRFRLLERSLGRPSSVLDWSDPAPVPAGLDGDDGRVKVELFFSFRSPYSYLILEPMLRLARRPDVDFVIRPVLPMVMRGLPVPRAKRLYILLDVRRLAREQGVPFGRACDPAGLGVERCMAVFFAARQAGCENAFVREAATAIWTRAANLTRDAELRPVVERSGLSWHDAQRGLADDASWRTMADHNRSILLDDMGLWGVPSVRVGGTFAVWGQDRVPILERMLDQR